MSQEQRRSHLHVTVPISAILLCYPAPELEKESNLFDKGKLHEQVENDTVLSWREVCLQSSCVKNSARDTLQVQSGRVHH